MNNNANKIILSDECIPLWHLYGHMPLQIVIHPFIAPYASGQKLPPIGTINEREEMELVMGLVWKPPTNDRNASLRAILEEKVDAMFDKLDLYISHMQGHKRFVPKMAEEIDEKMLKPLIISVQNWKKYYEEEYITKFGRIERESINNNS